MTEWHGYIIQSHYQTIQLTFSWRNGTDSSCEDDSKTIFTQINIIDIWFWRLNINIEIINTVIKFNAWNSMKMCRLQQFRLDLVKMQITSSVVTNKQCTKCRTLITILSAVFISETEIFILSWLSASKYQTLGYDHE